jgi:hypothetical protein
MGKYRATLNMPEAKCGQVAEFADDDPRVIRMVKNGYLVPVDVPKEVLKQINEKISSGFSEPNNPIEAVKRALQERREKAMRGSTAVSTVGSSVTSVTESNSDEVAESSSDENEDSEKTEEHVTQDETREDPSSIEEDSQPVDDDKKSYFGSRARNKKQKP